MKPERLEACLDELGLSQCAAARLLRKDDRTVRRWVAGELPVPPIVAMLLETMIARRVSPAKVQEYAGMMVTAS